MMPDRKISLEEIEVVRWLLANGAMKDVTEYNAESLNGARVVPGCTCGCATIDFVHAGSAGGRSPLRASAILAEAFTTWPDGARAGVILWGQHGRLLEIELYDLGGDASNRFPAVQNLRRWEDYYGDPTVSR